MDKTKKKWKENPILKTWKKIKSLGHDNKKKTPLFAKSKSWHCTSVPSSAQHITNHNNDGKKNKTPQGCFTVYVGPKKQRFSVKTELANHPLFKMLLEDAETEYGYSRDGPLLLPCGVDLFCKVLAEMECLDGDDEWANPPVCWLCSPYQNSKQNSSVINRYGSYKMLRMSPMVKLNWF